MEIWLWAVIGGMVVVLVALLAKIRLLQKAAGEMETAFAHRLITGTNTLIDISTGDKHMRHLANAINRELRTLRAMRHRFEQGDMELKHAVMNISHDLRTPLTAICGYLDLLEQEEGLPDVAGWYLEVIRNRAEMLTQLTEELFRYSIICSDGNHGATEDVAVNAVLEESIAAFYTALTEQGIAPRIQMPEHPVIRKLDRAALARIFSNLLHNAIKYSDGDLDITLSETGEVIFSNRSSGLDGVEVGRLFDRFYTVEAARTSTGLGLAIARTLTERMGGTISARYEDNQLSICIFFPDARHFSSCCPLFSQEGRTVFR